jgi:threonine/homoserine/homoserine lactone efflux protein
MYTKIAHCCAIVFFIAAAAVYFAPQTESSLVLLALGIMLELIAWGIGALSTKAPSSRKKNSGK